MQQNLIFEVPEIFLYITQAIHIVTFETSAIAVATTALENL